MSSRGARHFRPLLHPRAGSRLPADLRAGRVGALASALPRGLEDPGFETLLRRIDRGPVLAGNRVKVFTRGADAFAAMRAACLSAAREILLESYIFKDDATGQDFLRAVAAASRRGVAVRVLADAVGSFATRRAFWREMAASGAEVRLFKSVFPRSWWFQPFRDHRKIIVVDRKVAFTGGLNIGEEYGPSNSSPGETWRDTHVRVEGPAAWEMAVVFAEAWTRIGGSQLEVEPLAAAAAEGPGARVLVLDSRPWRGQLESAAILAAIVGAARRNVWITNAYFAPGRQAVAILAEAAARGVDVRLLLPGRTDAPLLRHAGHGYYADLLRGGVKVLEYRGDVLHAKTLVADGTVSVIGSSNLDFRSFVFNAECNLVIFDCEASAALEEGFRRDLQRSEEILPDAWRSRAVLHRLADRLARSLSPLL